MYKGIGWAALLSLAACASGPETGADVGYVAHVDPGSACELTGGTLEAPSPGATCGQQAGGETCIWSPMAVELGAQEASASCGDRDCACVTAGNVRESCAPSAPICSCGEGALYLDEGAGCADVADLEASFGDASVGDLIGEQGVWVMFRGGAIDEVVHYPDLEMLLEAHAWLGFGLNETCQLEQGTPSHDCDAEFGEAVGCYLGAASEYAGVSQRMTDLVDYAEQSYEDEALESARGIEAGVETTVTVTEAKLKLHFGRDGDDWKLLVIDATTYDCGG